MSFVGERALGRSLLVIDEQGTPHLEGSRCPTCGDVRVPRRDRCPIDLASCDPVLFAGQGTIYAIVKVSLVPQGFDASFWAGYVDLDEGARLFAQIAVPPELPPLVSGDRVRLTVAAITERDGESVYGPVFERVTG